MADLTNDVPSAAGSWLTFSEWDGAKLRALVHSVDNEPEAGVTVFWPARALGERFAAFFEEALPRVGDGLPAARRTERRQAYAPHSGDITELTASPPGVQTYDNVVFLRLEHLRLDANRHEHPILVAWCNLDAGRQSEVPEDAGGVLLQPRHLQGLEQPLAALIANTSAEAPGLSSVVSLLDALGVYLSGDAEPLAVAVRA